MYAFGVEYMLRNSLQSLLNTAQIICLNKLCYVRNRTYICEITQEATAALQRFCGPCAASNSTLSIHKLTSSSLLVDLKERVSIFSTQLSQHSHSFKASRMQVDVMPERMQQDFEVLNLLLTVSCRPRMCSQARRKTLLPSWEVGR